MKNAAPAKKSKEVLFDWLENWEKLLDEGAYDKGLLSILPNLEYFRSGYALSMQRNLQETQDLMERIVRAYTLFVSRASKDLVKQKYLDICRVKAPLGPITDAAGVSHLSAPQLWKKYHQPKEGEALDIIRALALVTLSNIHMFPGKRLTDMEPQYVAPLAYACIAQRCAFTKAQSQNKQWLLSLHEFYEKADLPSSDESYASLAWMYCSYVFWAGKHRIKGSINNVVTRWFEERNLVPPTKKSPRAKKKKPTIVIFAEHFSDSHAMFRCHGKSAIALKKKFITVLMADLERLSPKNRKMFSKVIQLDTSSKRVEKNLKMLRKIRPDMIYYPSIGMSRVANMICNLRLAPIQFLSMGHPASTFSKEIDYVIMNNDLRPDSKCFSEKLIHRRQSAGYAPVEQWDASKLGERKRLNPKFLHVGILGFLPKTTHEFLAVCKKLEAEVDHPIRFHFFPNSVSADFFGYRAGMSRELKYIGVHPRVDYLTYMQYVKAMDLVLSTFPFGNTNGTIDTLLAGVPMIALEGPEPHAKTDARLLRKVGAPEQMLASTIQDYYDTAKSWLSDPGKLAAIRQNMTELDVEGTFYSNEEESDFDEVVSLIYNAHERIQADDRREFEFEDLVAMQQAEEERVS